MVASKEYLSVMIINTTVRDNESNVFIIIIFSPCWSVLDICLQFS